MAFIINPFFLKKDDISDYKPVYELSRKYGVPLLNLANNEKFVGKPDSFQDITHLNDKGAKRNTQYKIHQIEALNR